MFFQRILLVFKFLIFFTTTTVISLIQNSLVYLLNAQILLVFRKSFERFKFSHELNSIKF